MYSKSKKKPRKSAVYADFGVYALLPLGKVFVTSNTLVNVISAVVFVIFVLY